LPTWRNASECGVLHDRLVERDVLTDARRALSDRDERRRLAGSSAGLYRDAATLTEESDSGELLVGQREARPLRQRCDRRLWRRRVAAHARRAAHLPRLAALHELSEASTWSDL